MLLWVWHVWRRLSHRGNEPSSIILYWYCNEIGSGAADWYRALVARWRVGVLSKLSNWAAHGYTRASRMVNCWLSVLLYVTHHGLLV